MSSKDLLFQLYKKFYEQRSVLNGAPALTLDVQNETIDTFNEKEADKELTTLISYMMGTEDVRKLSWGDALALVEKYYANQTQWQKLLLDYFSYSLEKEKENIKAQQINLFQDVLKQLGEKNEKQESKS